MTTFIIGAILLAAAALAVRKIIRDKKSGKSIQCGGDCRNCGGGCH